MSLDLHDCARRGDVIHLQLILSSKSAGANQRERGTRATCLHYAVQEQHVEVVEALLGFRADPNLADKDARTALHCVVSKLADPDASLTIAQMLLASGADPTLKSRDGETILHQASREGNLPLLTFLLNERKGELDLDCRNDRDETPLFFAAGNSHTHVVLDLLERGANPNIPNQKGRTPLHMALRWAKSDTKKIIEKAAAMAPSIEHVTLPSGTVIRRDLLPESFDEVMSKLRTQKEATSDVLSLTQAAGSPLEGASVSEHNGSFAAQVHHLGGQRGRQHHLSASPLQSLPGYIEGQFGSAAGSPAAPLPRRGDTRAQAAAAGARPGGGSPHTHQPGQGVEFPVEGGGGGGVGGASPVNARRPSNSPQHFTPLEQHAASRRWGAEFDRLADKERMRVDQRLRGLFYAGLQRAKEKTDRGDSGWGEADVSGGGVGGGGGDGAAMVDASASHLVVGSPGGRAATQKEEELARLTGEIKALKEAGFKDPAKEMRRLERDTRRKARAERKAQRDKEREEEDGSMHIDDQVIGEHSAELLQANVANVMPAELAFTLRKIVHPDTSAHRSGLFGVINGLETRLKSLSGMFCDLEKRCDQLNSVHSVLKQEVRSGRRRQGGPASPTAGGRGNQGPVDISALPRKDQRIISEFESRIDVLEKRAKREVKKRRTEAKLAGHNSTFTLWLLRVFLLVIIVTYFWLESAVTDLLPPPVWT